MEKLRVSTEAVPIIKLTLDSLKMSVMQMLDPEVVKKAIEQRINEAIKSFDFDGKVKREAEECLKEAVHGYFTYGEGGQLIQDAVKGALSESLKKCAKEIKKS